MTIIVMTMILTRLTAKSSVFGAKSGIKLGEASRILGIACLHCQTKPLRLVGNTLPTYCAGSENLRQQDYSD